MDFLNNAFRQLVDLFRSMTPAGRITTSVLLAAILASLLYLFRYQTDNADEYLFGGLVLSQSEIVAMEAAFGKHGLNNYVLTGNKLRVPRSKRDVYLAALAKEQALPQNADSPFLSMFENDSPFDNRETRERKARFALERQLGITIRQLPGVESATVTIDEQQASAFGSRKVRQALVAVKPLGGKNLDEQQVQNIRYTVSTGAGVPPESVTVSDLNGQIFPGLGKENGISEFQNIYATYQRQFANHYKQLILERLAAYRGVTVAVHVELDKDVQNQIIDLKYNDKPTPTKTSTLTKESSSNTGDNSGRPGAVPNGAVGNAPAQVANASATESTLNETREELQNVVGATQTTTQKAPLSPVYVSASIGIPRSYFAKVWQLNNPTPPGEEPKVPPPDQLKVIESETKTEIEEAVVALLPRLPKGDDQYKPVKFVPFTEIPITEPDPPSLASNAFDWFVSNWTTLGLFGLATFSVVFLRGMVRSAQIALPPHSEDKSDRSAQAAALEAEEEAAASGDPSESSSGMKRKFQTSGRSLRDELTDLVREDPDSAANVLKLWISDAA